MFNAIVFITVLTFCAPTVHSSSNIYWANSTRYTKFLARFQPAGLLDGSRPVQVCRTYIDVDKTWRSGWVEFTKERNVAECRAGRSGKEYKSKNFQVLLFPPGSTSWIPFTGKLPENPVIGGRHNIHEQGEVCRGYHKNSLLPGILYAPYGLCCIPLDGKEVVVTDADKIEILTWNSYSKMFDEQFPRS